MGWKRERGGKAFLKSFFLAANYKLDLYSIRKVFHFVIKQKKKIFYKNVTNIA